MPQAPHRPTADTITQDYLDTLYARLDRATRRVDRVDALADHWAGDQTPTTRSAAADIFLDMLDLEPDGTPTEEAPANDPVAARKRYAKTLLAAHRLAVAWAGDQATISRSEAADQLGAILDTALAHPPEAKTTPQPRLRAVPNPRGHR
jgi:hypothetical protein